MDRTRLADLIVARLAPVITQLRQDFSAAGRIGSCQIVDLLPATLARDLFASFPDTREMTLKRSIKERKYVTAQLDTLDPLIEEAVYAFQDPRVVDCIAQITGLSGLEPDENLYAGGISIMGKGGYLRPHLDNSHDASRARYRALNLLYYVTPDWGPECGGALQLWDHGPTGLPRTFPALFNSLVIMMTDDSSWHSVSEVTGDGRRCCVSNYYFSRNAPGDSDYFHSTSFRAEYGTGLSDLVMRADNTLRTVALRHAGALYTNPHVYRRRGRP